MTRRLSLPPRLRMFALVLLLWSGLGSLAVLTQGSAPDWLDRRLTTIESQSLDGRVRVLESDMAEVKIMTRIIAAAVVGQLVLIILSSRISSNPAR